jgi:hypothetical protein
MHTENSANYSITHMEKGSQDATQIALVNFFETHEEYTTTITYLIFLLKSCNVSKVAAMPILTYWTCCSLMHMSISRPLRLAIPVCYIHDKTLKYTL